MCTTPTKSPEEHCESVSPSPADQQLSSGILSKNNEHPITDGVLVYRGAFNPPHLGHLAVLRSGIKARTNLHVMATMTVVHPDSYLETKNEQADENFIVTWQDRARLWACHPDLNFDSPTWVRAARERIWDTFEKDLVDKTREQGYRVGLVELMEIDKQDGYLPSK